MSNVDHVFDNALGCVTELFSGSQNIWPQEGVPHQGFSTGGIVLPLVRGMLGLEGDAAAKQIFFEPHFPADWPEVSVENFRLGQELFGFLYKREGARVKLEVGSAKGSLFKMRFAPALGLGTHVRAARLNGQPLDFKVLYSGQVVQPEVEFGLTGRDIVEIEFDPTVEILPPFIESRVGDFNTGLKIIRVEREGRNLKVLVEGLAGKSYVLHLTNYDLVTEVTGAELSDGRLLILFPSGAGREF